MKASDFTRIAEEAGFEKIKLINQDRGVYSFEVLQSLSCRAFLFPAAGEVDTIQFYVGFNGYEFSESEVNRWNREYRFVKAYLFPDGTLAGETDIPLKGSEKDIIENLKLVRSIWTGNLIELVNFF